MPSTMPIVRKNHESSAQRRTEASHSTSRRRLTSAPTANANGMAVAT